MNGKSEASARGRGPECALVVWGFATMLSDLHGAVKLCSHVDGLAASNRGL